jgi:hypothetical protein
MPRKSRYIEGVGAQPSTIVVTVRGVPEGDTVPATFRAVADLAPRNAVVYSQPRSSALRSASLRLRAAVFAMAPER